LADSIQKYEQEHLDEVIGKIDAATQKVEQNINDANKDVKDIGNQFKDIKNNGTTYSGMVETAMSVRQQQQMLEQRETSRSHAERNLETLTKLKETPYFARIDFHENGEANDETIYIGLASFTDRPDHFLVYDWRAPISSIYYDGGLGNISYQTPDGPQEVDVKLKRQFQIADGVIVTVYDTDETVGDQMLLEALGTHSNTKMKSIVTTIQQAQNKIIRNTSADLLFVQGAAGSGKTAAVLQRIAWLLYRYRGNLNAGQVILFSPNQLFNDYINQVLPELGEHNMVQMTYFQFANRRLPNMQVQTLQQRFENDQTKVDSNITRLETSLEFFNATKRYAHHLEKEDMKFRNIMFNGKPFFSREKIEEIYYSFNQNYHLSNRLDATKEELVRMLNHRVSAEIQSKWVEEEVQNLTKQELDGLFGDQPREFDSADKEFKFLARQLVLKAFKPIKKAIDHNRWLNINAQFINFKRVAPHLINLDKYDLTKDNWEDHLAVNYDQLKERNLSANDVTVYLYLYDLITGKKGERDIRYVFVDEVQDYDAFQLAYLKFSFPRARFTLLGDLNQAIFTKENSRTLLAQLNTMFDPDKTEVVQLTKSYRSTKEITEFTRAILANGEAIEPFERTGAKPRVLIEATEEQAVSSLIDVLNDVQSDDDASAIIGKTLADSERIHDQLAARGIKTTLIRTENQRLANGTLVIPSFLAKGLEFDSVIIWDANAEKYAQEDERQLLYTICSRAMHALSVIGVQTMTPLLDQVPTDLYDSI